MVNIKKMDDKDFVFINKPLTAKEETAFSDFLKVKRTASTFKHKSRNKNLKQKEIAHNA
jgi:hypothetical protein